MINNNNKIWPPNSIDFLSEDDIIKMLEFLVDNIFVDFVGKVFYQISRYSNGNELCPSSSRYISVLK